MALNVGILGYGRLGRSLARRAHDAGNQVSVLFDAGTAASSRSDAFDAGLTVREIQRARADLDFLIITLNPARLRGTLDEALALAAANLSPTAVVATATSIDDQVRKFAPAPVVRFSCSPAIAMFPDRCSCYVVAEAPQGAVARLNQALAPASWKAVPEPEFEARERCFSMAGVVCALVAKFNLIDGDSAHEPWLGDAISEARLLLASTRFDAARAHDMAATPGGIVQSLSRQLLALGDP
jgi:hypothetical protein